MKQLDKKIIEFINKHHVLTLATSQNNEPYCANCFYAFMEAENSLVFTSDETTFHIQSAINQPIVAGSVVLETSMVGKIQGIQFKGILSKSNKEADATAYNTYMKRFPFARLMETTLWTLQLTFVKMTDNRLGFGKKLIWEND